MNQIETLKAQAKNLKHAMTSMGVAISLAQALEAIAQQYGVENWDTLAGMVNKTDAEAALLAGRLQLPSVPYKVDMKGCTGLHFECTVSYIDMETMALVHDEVALQAYLLANTEMYSQGLDTTGLKLRTATGREFEFRLSELVGMKGDNDDWYLTQGLISLRFYCFEEKVAMPAPKSALTIPQMVKSAKGCQLVLLPSCDGAHYDRHVIVPPHLHAEVVSKKIKEEICRLKEIDAANEENDNYDGYTEADIARYVGGIGCLWVGKPIVCGENWD